MSDTSEHHARRDEAPRDRAPHDRAPHDGARPAAVSSLSSVRFLTVAEVAAVMRVSKMSVYRLIHAGDLEAVRFGRTFRVPESAVHAYLKDAFYDVG